MYSFVSGFLNFVDRRLETKFVVVVAGKFFMARKP